MFRVDIMASTIRLSKHSLETASSIVSMVISSICEIAIIFKHSPYLR